MYNSKFLNINSPTNLPLGADLVWGQWGYVPPPKFRNLFWLILKSQNLKKKLNQSPLCCLLKILWTALKFYKLLGTFKKKKKKCSILRYALVTSAQYLRLAKEPKKFYDMYSP